MMPDSAYYNRNILLEKAIPFSKHLANELLMEIAAVNKIFNKFIEISLTSPSQIWCDCQLRFPNPVPQMSPIRRRQLRKSASCLAATVLLASGTFSSNTVSAANVSWTDATNKWESNNWTGGVGTNPPTAADTAIIGNNGIVNYDATTGTRTVLALQVGNPNIGNGTLNISAGSLTVSNNV